MFKRFKLSRQRFLVSGTDNYIAFVGTKRECKKAIDELHGDIWLILKYENLTEELIYDYTYNNAWDELQQLL